MNSIKFLRGIGAFVLALVALVSCQESNDDSRAYEAAVINAVKLDGELYLAQTDGNTVTVNTPDGKSLENLKLQILLSNGKIENFVNDSEVDCRYPMPIEVSGNDGVNYTFDLHIISRPKLTTFVIDGVEVIQYIQSATKILAQVPVGTDVNALKISMAFANGELQNFNNGAEYNYTDPRQFSILGVDEQTVYPYTLVVTDKTVGPATIEAMTINGFETSKVVVTDAAAHVVVPYVDAATNFADATITIIGGLDNEIDPEAKLTNLNLYAGNNKVKITGSDGSVTEFTIGVPQIGAEPMYKLEYSDIKLGGDGNAVAANSIRGAALSQNYVVLSAQNNGVGGGLYYDYTTGEYGGTIDYGTGVNWGLHKVASDTEGALLFSELGLTANKQTVYKWNEVTATREPYIQFTGAEIGSATPSYRNSGISIDGSLDGDARVILTTAQRAEAFIWTVTNGVLNTTPERFAPAVNTPSYYWTVAATDGTDNFVSAVPSNGGNAIYALNQTMALLFQISGVSTTDVRTICHNGRTYLAYAYLQAGVGGHMRLADITDGDQPSYSRIIMDYLFDAPTAGAGNGCASIDMKIVDGELHVMYFYDNVGVAVFNLQ